MKKVFSFILIAVFVFPVYAQKSLKKKLKELDSFYEASLKEWEVPGMAIAIVKDDSLVFAKGYGLSEINTGKKVDANTIFPIASNTKAFTAAALGMLVEEGKLHWDDKVREHLPWFEMYDPYVTVNMTVRDLLCHRSGLKTFAGDLLWYETTYNRREVVERARFLEPTYGFRAHYGYSNIMYLAAGLIIEEITGLSWDEYIRQEFLKPLNMNRAITSTNELGNFNNVAAPHTTHDGKIIPISYQNWDNIAPAGGIIASVNDVSQWLKMQLNKGVYKNDTLLNTRTINEMWAPQTIQGVSIWTEQNFPTNFKSYGLGWALMDYHGKKVVSHGGGYDGMISQSAMVPEEELGLVVLTNKNSWLILPVLYKTLDVFLSDQDKDWSDFYLKFWNNRIEAGKERIKKLEENRIKNTMPSLPLESYTGIYHDKMYGDAEIILKDGKLSLQLVPAPDFKGHLKHYHFDTFEIGFFNFPSLPKGLVNFDLNEKGEISSMKIDVPNPDFDFTEMKFIKK